MTKRWQKTAEVYKKADSAVCILLKFRSDHSKRSHLGFDLLF